jgi:hypothetical protein
MAAFVAPTAADTVMDHNIAGAHSVGGAAGSTTHLQTMISRAQGVGGWAGVLSLNEACGNQMLYFISAAQNAGNTYSTGSYVSGANPAGCTLGFGNLIMAKTSGYTPTAVPWTYAYDSANITGPGMERKGGVCVSGGLGSPKYYACSTHLWPNVVFSPTVSRVGYKQQEWKQLAFNMAVWKTSAAKKPVVAGDFYLTRGEMVGMAIIDTPNWPNLFNESGACAVPNNNDATHIGSGRIDNVWFDRSFPCANNGAPFDFNSSWFCMFDANWYESCNASDHRGINSFNQLY